MKNSVSNIAQFGNKNMLKTTTFQGPCDPVLLLKPRTLIWFSHNCSPVLLFRPVLLLIFEQNATLYYYSDLYYYSEPKSKEIVTIGNLMFWASIWHFDHRNWMMASEFKKLWNRYFHQFNGQRVCEDESIFFHSSDAWQLPLGSEGHFKFSSTISYE